MARTIGAGTGALARSVQARFGDVGARGGGSRAAGTRERRRRHLARRAELDGAVSAGLARAWLGAEALEGRTLLTAQPILVYNFTAPPDAGDVVTNTGVGGTAYNGTFQPTGAGGPARIVRDNTAGDTSNTAAITLNGTNNVIETATPLQPILGKSGSVTAWFRTTQAGSANAWEAPGITGVEDAGTENDIFWGWLNATGNIVLQVGNDGGNSVRSINAVNDGFWHHVAMTRDMVSGEIRLFLDGVLQQSDISQTGEKGNPAQGGLPAGFLFKTIGAIEDEAGIGSRDEFAGGLDEVLIFDRPLTNTEITQIYNTGPGGGGGPNGSAATVTVAPVTGRPAELTLSWTQATPDTNESGYEILRSTSAGGPFVSVGLTGPDATSFRDAGLNPGTQYFYKIRAFNLAANGPESNVANATTVTMATIIGPGIPGAVGEFFNNSVNNQNEPIFGPAVAQRRVIRVDPNVNLDFGTNNPDPLVNADDHSIRYSGYITAPETGVYTFVTSTDDGGYLYVNGALVSQDPYGHGARPAIDLTPISLAAGQRVPFVIYQADHVGGSFIQMNWIRPNAGGTMEVVPASVITTPDLLPQAATGVTATATPRTITLNWNHRSLNETGVTVEMKRAAEPDSAYREIRRYDIGINNPTSTDVVAGTTAIGLDVGTSYTFRITDFNTQGNAVTTFTTSTQSPPAGTLNVNQAPAPANVNLTNPASIDWRHWGLSGPTSTNTKLRGGNPAGVVVFEAESGGVFTDPDNDGLTFNVVNESDASDGRALRSNDADTAAPVDSAFVTWTLNFPQAGDYTLFIRRKVDGGGGDNSLWRHNTASLDVDPSQFANSMTTQFDNQGGFANQYVWAASDGISPAGQPANAGPVIYNVATPGNHTLTLGARELGYRIDKIALIPTALVPANDAQRQAFLDSLETISQRNSGPITNFTPVGSPTVVADSSAGNTFTWSNGVPTPSATATPTGIATSGAGNGFRFTVPASSGAARQLRVFLGVGDGASGDLTLRMSDGSVAPVVRTLTDAAADGQPTLAVYTIDVASGFPNQTLQVDWVSNGGQIILKAAEFFDTAAPPAPQVTATPTGHGLISLQWTDLGNETSYVIERAPDANGSPGAFTTLATLPANSNAYVDNAGPDNKFHYRVRATNGLGGTNSPVVSATAPRFEAPGFNATYFNHAGNTPWRGPSTRRFDTGVNQVDSAGRGPIDFFWADRSPVPGVIPINDFSSRWEGYIVPNFTELYTFFADTDDGAGIYIDVNENGTFEQEEQIFRDVTGHGVGTQRSSTDPVWSPAFGKGLYLGGVPLVAGHHYRVRFEQFEGGGDAGARFFWQSPNTPNQIVPLASTRALEIPDLVAPTVADTVVNGHIPSTATYTPNFHIIIKFSEPVISVEDTDFNIDTSLGFLDSSSFDVAYDPASQTAIITFPDLQDARLPDGNGTIFINDGRITDSFGNALDGDNNGSAGGQAIIPFYVLTGDTQMAQNGTNFKDRKVSFVDYQVMSKNFGMTNASGADGDFNYDGVVNNADFLILRQLFGQTLAPPPAPVPAKPAPRPKAPAAKPAAAPAPAAAPSPLNRAISTTAATPAKAPQQSLFANRRIADNKDWLASN